LALESECCHSNANLSNVQRNCSTVRVEGWFF